MFLIENVLTGLLIGLFVFVLFTYVNVHSFCKDILTSVILTFNVLYLFIVMPFKGVSEIHKNKHKIIRHLKKNPDVALSDREAMKKVLNSKVRIFSLLYRNNAFSYNELVLEVARWYLDKPFKLRISLKFFKQEKERYVNAYMSSLQHDLKEAIC